MNRAFFHFSRFPLFSLLPTPRLWSLVEHNHSVFNICVHLCHLWITPRLWSPVEQSVFIFLVLFYNIFTRSWFFTIHHSPVTNCPYIYSNFVNGKQVLRFNKHEKCGFENCSSMAWEMVFRLSYLILTQRREDAKKRIF